MITKQMIADGLAKHLVQLVTDPNEGAGTVCQIGEWWFYFDTDEAPNLEPDAYVSNVSIADIVDKIFDTLQDFKTDDTFKDEYDYYEAVLSEGLAS